MDSIRLKKNVLYLFVLFIYLLNVGVVIIIIILLHNVMNVQRDLAYIVMYEMDFIILINKR